MTRQDTTMPRPAKAAALPAELGLVVLASPDPQRGQGNRGEVRRLSSRGLTLGRGESAAATSKTAGPRHWTFDDPMASRLHATISWDAKTSRFVLADSGSRNGTQVGGVDITEVGLVHGQIVRLGDTLLAVRELDPALPWDWQPEPACPLVGASPELQRMLHQVAKVAPSKHPVLIEGETGTGKELVAAEIHRQSGRSGRLVAVNCAALVSSLVESELFGHRAGAFSGAASDHDGVFVQAAGGTILLDEIGELPMESQAKLLRVLEQHEVRPVGATKTLATDARVVCATHRTLSDCVAAGTFRADLHARIDQLRIHTPPLRGRPEDLLPIIAKIADEEGRAPLTVGVDTLEALALHPFPYNVRELSSMVRRALLEHPDLTELELSHIGSEIQAQEAISPRDRAPREPDGEELEALLRRFEGRVADVARHLGRGRTQLYRWMRKHGLDPSDFRVT